MLTEDTVRASDRRAQFIGLEAYERAGGAVMRDLFAHDDGGWLQDVPLLDRLVTAKLKADAEGIAPEGWKWIAEVTIAALVGHAKGSVTSKYIHTLDTALIMAADTISGYIQGLLDGIEFKQTAYALDRDSRKAALARFLKRASGSDQEAAEEERRLAA